MGLSAGSCVLSVGGLTHTRISPNMKKRPISMASPIRSRLVIMRQCILVAEAVQACHRRSPGLAVQDSGTLHRLYPEFVTAVPEPDSRGRVDTSLVYLLLPCRCHLINSSASAPLAGNGAIRQSHSSIKVLSQSALLLNGVSHPPARTGRAGPRSLRGGRRGEYVGFHLLGRKLNPRLLLEHLRVKLR